MVTLKQSAERNKRNTAYHVTLVTQDAVAGGLCVTEGGDMGLGPHHPLVTPPRVPNSVTKETWEPLGEIAAKLVGALK